MQRSNSEAQIEIQDLRVVYKRGLSDPGFVAVDSVSVEVKHQEFIAILGPSGCGKSTTLMAVAGLTPYTSGSIHVEGVPITAPGPDRAVVFQEFALLPWRTVRQNVSFGLELQRRGSREDRVELVGKYIRMVGLAGFEDYYPHQLSGGMRQRVGIARALVVSPRILLMDEPFGSLDAQTREVMGMELLRIWEEEKKTVLFVTHSIDEAIFLADRVVLMTAHPGKVKMIIPIKISRPRDFESRAAPEFSAHRDRIWSSLKEEVDKAMEFERSS